MAACTSAASNPPADPAVVVLISIDQLRADLVSRYDAFYTGGFRRLIDQGAYFEGVHDHGISETAAGHATLSTGTVPARTGIVANDWLQRVGEEWVNVYTVADTTSPILGFPEMEGRSPLNLLRSGLAEWIVEANPEAKVVSVAGKDRVAVLLAAHARGEIYWYEAGKARFVTSSYYRDAYPEWVDRFNAEVLPTLLDSVWDATASPEARALARPDTAPYEGDGVHTYFPHRYDVEGGERGESFADWVAGTPYPDRATLEFAKVAVREAGLGDDEITDYLALGFSQTDRIGHDNGPLSQEQLENLLHLDRVLGDLFDFLDEEIGEGRWIAALSADHGALTMPEWRAEHGEPGKRLTRGEREEMLRVAEAALAKAAPGEEAAAQAQALRELPFLHDVYTRDELASGEPRDSVARLLRNSFHPERTKPDLARRGWIAIGPPGTYMSTARTGSGHGTPWFYDRNVPVIFLGAGIQTGRRSELVRTVDVAPTLAAVAGIAAPDDLDGEVLPVTTAP